MNKAISIGTAFILGVGAGWLLQGRHWDTLLTSYIPALVTLLAAFYGAKYAFQFQNDKEIRDEKKRNLVDANAVIFGLMRMANTLFVYRRDFIIPVKNSPTRCLDLRPSPPLEKLVHLNISGLYFLLETDHRNLLGEIIAEEEKYRSVIDTINTRSRMHIDEFQLALETKPIVPGGDTLDSIRTHVGDRIFRSLEISTDQVIYQVENYILSIEKVGNKLTSCIKEIYPDDAAVIRFELPK